MIRNWRPLFAPVCLTALAALLISCAGVGGAGGGATTGNPGDGPLGCSLDTFSPNYLTATDPSTDDENDVHWWDGFPLRVYFTSSPTIQGQQMVSVAMAGFNAWSEVAGKTLAVQVQNEGDADIVVVFDHLNQQPGSGDYVGRTSWSYNPSTFETFSAEMVLRTWNGMTANQAANGFRRTAQHEFGHALFLGGHSPFQADTMYPFGSISTYTALTERDENSLLTAYCGSFENRATTLREGVELVRRTISCPADHAAGP